MSFAKFRDGDRLVRGSSGVGILGTVEHAISDGFAEILWDDDTRSTELIGDVTIIRPAHEQEAIERRIRAVERDGFNGLIQVMRENGDPMADQLARIVQELN